MGKVREEYITLCRECMGSAPFPYCCKLECGQHEFCRGCTYLNDSNYIDNKMCRKRNEEVKEKIADREVNFGVYQHFKGNLYLVLDIGYDSSDNEEVVIYRALYPDSDGKYRIWVRKKKEFLEKVTVDGKEKSRFCRWKAWSYQYRTY